MRLLCTFGNRDKFDVVVNYIKSTYIILNNNIYVFEDVDDDEKFIYSYNIDDSNEIETTFDTISIHRNGNTNTLYTINALNMMIRNMNNGILDRTIKVNWILYPNSLLLAVDNELKIINLNLFKKIFVD